MRLAKSLTSMPSSGIRDMMNHIVGMDDVINLAPGEPQFPTPPHIVDAAHRATEAGHTKYVSNAGIPELRERLCRKLKEKNGIDVGIDEIVVTHGAMGALYAAFVALVEPGDEVLLPDPAWPNFGMMAALRSATVRNYRVSAENGFLPEIDELEELVSPATTLMLINTPLNPVGSVIPHERMEAVLRFAAAHDLWVVSDEAYEDLTYTDGFVSAASLPHRDRVVGVYSFSKSYAMTGWHVGYMVIPPEMIPLIADLQEAMLSCGSARSVGGVRGTGGAPERGGGHAPGLRAQSPARARRARPARCPGLSAERCVLSLGGHWGGGDTEPRVRDGSTRYAPGGGCSRPRLRSRRRRICARLTRCRTRSHRRGPGVAGTLSRTAGCRGARNYVEGASGAMSRSRRRIR